MDLEQGLGAMPLGVPAGAPSARHRRRPRATGPVLPGLLISGILAGAVMLHDPGMTGYRFRQVVDHLTGSGGGTYAFVVTTSDGDPVGWDHCEPIHYVVNPSGGPADWENTVEDADRRDQRGERLRVRVRRHHRRPVASTSGSTDPPRTRRRCSSPGPTRARSPTWRARRPASAAARRCRSGGRVHFVTGIVVLDTDAYDRMEVTGRHHRGAADPGPRARSRAGPRPRRRQSAS